MSNETVKTISKTWMERVWNQLDTSAIDEMIAEGHVSYGAGDPIEGKAGWHAFHSVLTGAYEQIHFEIMDQIIEGDKVAARWEGTLVHRATGTAVPLSGMWILQVSEGQVIESWNTIDFIPLLMTLELIPGDAMDKALAPSG